MRGEKAEDRLHHFAAAGADEAGEAENLAAPQAEADVLEVDARKAAHVETTSPGELEG